MAELEVAPRRMASPEEVFQRAKLEPIHQPLYSYVGVGADDAAAALPRELRWFNYAIGNDITRAAGLAAEAATIIHTNMEQAGALATPKMFLVTGVRCVHSPLTFDLTAQKDARTAAVAPGADQLLLIDDLVNINGTTLFRFHVGTKDYVRCPMWNVPGNAGLGGVANTGVQSNADAFRSAMSVFTRGKYYGLPQHPIWIPSQQTFYATMEAPQGQPAVFESGVWCVLDGIFGRETQ